MSDFRRLSMDGSAGGAPHDILNLGDTPMSNTPVRLSGRWPLAAVILAALTATATAGSFMRECAARDMQILMLIEDRNPSLPCPQTTYVTQCFLICTRGSSVTRDMFSMPLAI